MAPSTPQAAENTVPETVQYTMTSGFHQEQALRAALAGLSEDAKFHRERVQDEKATNTKKEYHRKKLKKTMTQIIGLLQRLQSIQTTTSGTQG